MTAPNGPSQQRVIRQALANARLSTADVDAVEAHGTGTTLGDPIEAQALLATYGQDRETPLLLGSVKSNIGHTQAAAGVAGVIKMVLAMRHGLVPPTLHVDEPSPHVDWSAGAVALATEATPWPDLDRPRRAAVSSFGISGTNAHVILEHAPATAAPAEFRPGAATDAGVVALPLSAADRAALPEQAARLRAHLAAYPEFGPAEVAHALTATRTAFPHRAVVLGQDPDELLRGLTALVDGETVPTVVTGTALRNPAPVFVFSGHGGHWPGMAADLLDGSPVFAASIAECETVLSPWVDWSLTDVLRGVDGAPPLVASGVVQPALWAVMVSLARLWRSLGVRPGAVVGHSQGEIAAACVAGALSLEDGARIVALRSQVLADIAGRGGMASVALPAERAHRLLRRWDDRLCVAVVNGPGSVVVAGDPDALAELVAACAADDVRVRPLDVDYASHSPHVEAVADRLLASLAGITARPAEVPFYSALTGEQTDTTTLDADYWYRNLRQTVNFEQAVRTLLTDGHQVFLEVGPHPVLSFGMQETIDDGDHEAAVVNSLRRDAGGWPRVLTALAELHTRGVGVDWTAVCGIAAGPAVPLPTYAFHRQRYWPDSPVRTGPVATAEDPADRQFWDAVERADADALVAALDVDGNDARALGEALPVLSGWRQRRRDETTVDAWRYRVRWQPLTTASTVRLTGTWLLVAPAAYAGDPLVGQVVAALGEAGAGVVPVTVADPDRSALAAQLADLDTDAITGVLSLLALDETDHPDRPVVPAGLAGTLALVQALGDAGCAAPLWCATRGAASTGRADPLDHPRQALVWGLGRVVALEHPDRWGGLVDLPAVLDRRARGRLAVVLAGVGHEDQLAVRPSGLFGRRLARAGGDTPPTGAGWQPTGTVLVTGGLGSLGAHVARWLARDGADHLVLTGRQGPAAPGAAELEAELTALGATVTIAACDVADPDALRALVDRLTDQGVRVDAVFHAAGVAHAGPLDATGLTDLADGLHAKVAGAVNLDRTFGGDVAAFVLFSSGAGVWGGGLQGGYAAGNAFLDALAEDRRRRGLPATAVAWGAWDGGGMMDTEGAADQMFRSGVRPMRPDLAVAVLARALAQDETTLAVADIAWDRFHQTYALARPRPLIEDLPEVARLLAATRVDDEPAESSPLRGRLAGLAEPDRRRALLELVRMHAAAVLGHASAEAIGADRPFRDLGFDSLSAVEMRNRIAEAVGLRLPATLVFDRPTPELLAAWLADRILGVTETAPTPTRAVAALDEPIAVVAMSCRYPGGVDSPEELWRLVADGRDAIGPFPADRGWDLDAIYDPDPDTPGTSYAREGGFVTDVGGFDAGLFGISPREALVMDPQQRLLLETGWELFERAGLAPAGMRDSSTGVFVGTNGQDYATLLMAARAETEGYQATGNAAAVVSGRLSYTFGLQGPAVTVDTACSSSLVALHLAVQALRAGECDLAMAGGVTVMATPGPFLEFARQRGLAADGRCKSFAASADGTGWGEGAGLVLLQRLSDARRDGRRVLAVVRGSAVNQDGASNGLTAPNGPAQQRVIRQALANAGLTPADVDAVDGHGTGTRLGDPIEAQALLATYGQDRPADRPLLLGSVKSNLGHTQAAAGVSGVIKMVLALQHGLLPPTLHVDEPTPHVDWSTGGIDLLTEARPWPQTDRPRRAAVSAFGVSGTNAHVVLEAAPPVDDPAPEPETPPRATLPLLPWPLSAADSDGLRAQATRLATHLAADTADGADTADTADDDAVARTLATARSHLRHRAVLLAGDPDTRLAALRALAAGEDHPAVHRDVAAPGGALAMLFSGQGAQHAGMGRELYQALPTFAEALDEVCQHLDAHLPRPLKSVLFAAEGSADAALLDQTAFTQAGLFAVEVALHRQLADWGVRPDLVAGHSVGEITAAHVAGVLTLPDACTLVGQRGRLMQALPAGGGMLAVAAGETEVTDALAGHTDRAAVAAVNGPAAVVVAGADDALSALAEDFTTLGVRTKRLTVSHAFHSPLMEPMLAEFATVAAGLDYAAPTVPLVSNLTGRVVDADEIRTPDYWVRHVREAVRFGDTVTHLRELGVGTLLEVGPDTVLTALAADALPDGGPLVTGVQRRGRDEVPALLGALARLHCHGVPVDWAALLPDADPADLPTYAFRHQRYWPVGDGEVLGGAAAPAATDPVDDAFWQVVTAGDGDALADRFGVDPDRPLRDQLPTLADWHQRRRADAVADGWRYRITWPRRQLTAGPAAGDWLLVTPTDDPADAAGRLAELIGAHGGDVRTLTVDPATVTRADLAGHLPDRPSRIVSLLALDERPHPAYPGVPAGLTGNLALVQAVTEAAPTGPLWLLTRQAVSTGPGDPLTRPTQATTWGLGLVTALEHPAHAGGLLDLPADLDAATGEHLLRALTNTDGEDQLAVRPTGVHLRRLTRAPRPTRPDTPAWSAPDTVLITGGTGAIGRYAAGWFARHGARRLILVSRRGPDAPGVADTVAELADLGAQTRVVAADLADRAAVTALVDALRAEGETVRAVVHAAGVGRLNPLRAVATDELADVVSGKTAGARHLDELLDADELELVVYFSSIAAAWGVGDHGAYAAANAFLDAWAQSRPTGRARVVSVNWGPWAGGGMVSAEHATAMSRRGVTLLDREPAMAALRAAITGDGTVLTVADVDWARFAPVFAAARHRPLIADLPEVAAPAAADPGDVAGADTLAELRKRLADLPTAEQNRLLVDLIRAAAAEVIGHDSPHALEADRPFRDLGFDSLTAVELRGRLARSTGLDPASSVVFDYPTPQALAEHLRGQLVDEASARELPTVEELDRLEEALTLRERDDIGRVRITMRLHRLLERLGADEPAESTGDVADRLRTASNQELFDLLDRDLGLS
nr:type I polyketide synthase [Micromonospora sp. NBS 11-29]